MKITNYLHLKEAGLSIFLILFAFTNHAFSQETTTENAPTSPKFEFSSINKEKMFQPIVSIESWGTYSMDETDVENRADISFRRFRFGGKGAPFSWLKYSFQLNFDRLGEDGYASTKGSYSGLGVWNAYITAKILKNSELLNIHAGYYWAAVSRETNTSPWAVSAFDKTRADWYLRKFQTGKGNGIESGIGLGGLYNMDKFGISYRLGTYEPDAYTSSEYHSRLYTGRVMISIGDPEQKSYKFMLSGNQWRKRTGVTIGFGGSSQSNGALTDTTYFDKSSTYGADLAVDYKGIHIDGEYYLLNRTAEGLDDFDGTVYHIRASYNMILANKYYLEPAVTYEYYEGEGTKSLYKHIGDDKTVDIGVNWYLSQDKLKLALHYVIQDGEASSNLGDYIGFACQVKL